MAAAQFWAKPAEAADRMQPKTKIPRKPRHDMMRTSNVTILTQTADKTRQPAPALRPRRKWHVSPPVRDTPHRQVFHAAGKKPEVPGTILTIFLATDSHRRNDPKQDHRPNDS
jgi:hypothetical protein